MTKKDKIQRVKELKSMIDNLKREIDYNNVMQQSLKLILNGSYGAFATQYFILFNNQVAGTITAEGRELTKTMSKLNEDYWYNQWHLDEELHNKLVISNVKKIREGASVSVYGDTDSIFVGFKPCIDSCDWKNKIFNVDYLNSINQAFAIIKSDKINIPNFNNNNFKGYIDIEKDSFEIDSIDKLISKNLMILIDSAYINNWELNAKLKGYSNYFYNWNNELDFIHGMDKFRIADYFKKCLDEHAKSYGVTNEEDFELEKISESIINIAKKKYIQHIVWEDGIDYERLSYFQPKGVELVRSSTPLFARDKIPNVIKYLFSKPETFNIKELLKIIKDMRKEFELADIDSISMQSSCNKYGEKVIDDKEKLQFVTGAHFAVKAAAHHNFLLHKNKSLQTKYDFLKSGDKIKYYYCNDSDKPIFAFKRGDFPLEFAPEVDYDTQFEKSILSPINSVIEPLGLPEISKRLSVVMDIFSNL